MKSMKQVEINDCTKELKENEILESDRDICDKQLNQIYKIFGFFAMLFVGTILGNSNIEHNLNDTTHFIIAYLIGGSVFIIFSSVRFVPSALSMLKKNKDFLTSNMEKINAKFNKIIIGIILFVFFCVVAVVIHPVILSKYDLNVFKYEYLGSILAVLSFLLCFVDEMQMKLKFPKTIYLIHEKDLIVIRNIFAFLSCVSWGFFMFLKL